MKRARMVMMRRHVLISQSPSILHFDFSYLSREVEKVTKVSQVKSFYRNNRQWQVAGNKKIFRFIQQMFAPATVI